MATYSYLGPGADDKDTVRFLIGDVNSSEWMLSDEEIQFTLDKYQPEFGTCEYAASVLADNLAARYAREASLSADGVSVGLGQVAQQFMALAANLREQHRNLLVGGFPDVGGITPGEELEPNTVPFAFGRGIHDYDEAGEQDFGGFSYAPPPEEIPGQY